MLLLSFSKTLKDKPFEGALSVLELMELIGINAAGDIFSTMPSLLSPRTQLCLCAIASHRQEPILPSVPSLCVGRVTGNCHCVG